jgi:hypothetical protein
VRARTTTPGPALAAAADGPLDWQHAAVVTTSSASEAEAWARACFEDAPLLLRLFLTIGWRLLLLEGSARSDGAHVLGWPIASTSPETTVLQRRSHLGIIATLVFSAQSGTATFASGMRFGNRFARIVWAGVAPIHRWAVSFALGHASARMPSR